MVTESSLLISLCSESFISIIIINHHFYKYGHDSFFCSRCDIITWCHRGEAEPSVFSLFVCTFIHLYRLFSHQPRRLRSSSSVSSVSSWASSSSQLVPKFDKRFSVLPDQLVTEHDVPAGGEGNREHDGRWCQKHVSLLEEEIRIKKNTKTDLNFNWNTENSCRMRSGPESLAPPVAAGGTTACRLSERLLWLVKSLTYTPNKAPPKWAAWSKNFHPNTRPAVSMAMMPFRAWRRTETFMMNPSAGGF